jgi:hypothetical protein
MFIYLIVNLFVLTENQNNSRNQSFLSGTRGKSKLKIKSKYQQNQSETTYIIKFSVNVFVNVNMINVSGFIL